MHYVWNNPLRWTLAILVIIIQACSYDTLTIFFDGVPDPNKLIMEPVRQELDSTKVVKPDIISSQSGPRIYFHGPYQAKLCTNCHAMTNGNNLTEPVPELCFGCHGDFIDNLKTVHGPVAAGLCGECHNAHKSKYEFILNESAEELCSKCHERDDSFNNKLHSDASERLCIECHSPHGSNKQYLLL